MKHNTTKKQACQYQFFKIGPIFLFFASVPPPDGIKPAPQRILIPHFLTREAQMRAHYFIERFVRQLLSGMAVGGAVAAVLLAAAAAVFRILS